jgi:hypothetical protein
MTPSGIKPATFLLVAQCPRTETKGNWKCEDVNIVTKPTYMKNSEYHKHASSSYIYPCHNIKHSAETTRIPNMFSLCLILNLRINVKWQYMFSNLTRSSNLVNKFHQISARHGLPCCACVQMIYWHDITICCLVRCTYIVTPTYRTWQSSEQHYCFGNVTSQD